MFVQSMKRTMIQMTNEQVIQILKNMISNQRIMTAEMYEALDMAIEALSESKRDLSEDTIYRQEAIKILEQICPKRPIGETDVMKAWVKAQTHLMRMPSAQPEQSEWEIFCDDDSPWDASWICKRCKANVWTDEPLYKNFCPNCGADMRGEIDEDSN